MFFHPTSYLLVNKGGHILMSENFLISIIFIVLLRAKDVRGIYYMRRTKYDFIKIYLWK